jgi:hypothetical protein
MKQYKVIGVIAICAPQREKLPRGTVKPESYFVDGQISELIGRKMIAAITEDVPEVKETGTGGAVDITKLSKTDLQNLCTEKGIEFVATDTKAMLIELLTAKETPAE